MSTQYKLKKYMSKLETAQSLDKVDAYMAKIKKYKQVQNGGVNWTWEGDVSKSLVELKRAKDQIKDGLQVNTAGVAEAVRDIVALKDNAFIASEALDSALQGLDKLIKEAHIEVPDQVMVDVLEPIIKAIGEPRPVEKFEPNTLWGRIFGRPTIPPPPPSVTAAAETKPESAVAAAAERSASPATEEAETVIPQGAVEGAKKLLGKK